MAANEMLTKRSGGICRWFGVSSRKEGGYVAGRRLKTILNSWWMGASGDAAKRLSHCEIYRSENCEIEKENVV